MQPTTPPSRQDERLGPMEGGSVGEDSPRVPYMGKQGGCQKQHGEGIDPVRNIRQHAAALHRGGFIRQHAAETGSPKSTWSNCAAGGGCSRREHAERNKWLARRHCRACKAIGVPNVPFVGKSRAAEFFPIRAPSKVVVRVAARSCFRWESKAAAKSSTGKVSTPCAISGSTPQRQTGSHSSTF